MIHGQGLLPQVLSSHGLIKNRMVTMKTNLSPKTAEAAFIALIAVLIAIVTSLHYTTSVQMHNWHEVYRIFFYVPVILAAFRYRVRGGIITALVSIVIYYPHIVFQWGGGFLNNFSRFLQMAMYVVIGLVTGILAEREHREQRRYQRVADELKLSYQRLQEQAEQMAELEDQLRLSERLSVLGELSASLAHEVRNPLASIWGVVEILQDKCGQLEGQTEFMDILVKEVKRLNEVVSNYLALAKKSRVKVTKCSLPAVIRSVVMLLNYRARRAQIRLITQLPDDDVYIRADEGQLRQMLINLVLNAIAAVEDEGDVTISLMKEPDQRRATLAIRDTGVGIAKSNFKKIFHPFYTTKPDGTGLGLSIVKRIADQQNWQLGVESTLNAGTTISIIFPMEYTTHD